MRRLGNYIYIRFIPVIIVTIAIAIIMVPCAIASDLIFKDVSPSDQSYQSIQFLVDKNIIHGYPDGTFRPNTSISRAEMATLLVNAKGINIKTNISTPTFIDVNIDNWAYQPIEACVKEGLLKGDGNGIFRPNDPVSRAETAVILSRMVSTKFPIAYQKKISDLPQGHWAEQSVLFVLSNEIMNLVDGDKFEPDKPATRGNVAIGLGAIVKGLQDKLFDNATPSQTIDATPNQTIDVPKYTITSEEDPFDFTLKTIYVKLDTELTSKWVVTVDGVNTEYSEALGQFVAFEVPSRKNNSDYSIKVYPK